MDLNVLFFEVGFESVYIMLLYGCYQKNRSQIGVR